MFNFNSISSDLDPNQLNDDEKNNDYLITSILSMHSAIDTFLEKMDIGTQLIFNNFKANEDLAVVFDRCLILAHEKNLKNSGYDLENSFSLYVNETQIPEWYSMASELKCSIYSIRKQKIDKECFFEPANLDYTRCYHKTQRDKYSDIKFVFIPCQKSKYYQTFVYLNIIINDAHIYGEILQLIIIEIIRKVYRFANPKNQANYIQYVYILLKSQSLAVQFKASHTLISLSNLQFISYKCIS
jgi:hypothetical protein